MMIDYEAIAALSAVIETQSFLSAAEKLFITQSAVSQRIKSLENYYGEPVLIRTLPYKATQLGLNLLKHYKQVTLLEDALNDELLAQINKQRISIAISRDSLETWFVEVIEQLKNIPTITLEIIADDQDLTLSYLQNGLVSACASTASKSISGCKAEFLGYFDYVMVASPEFQKLYFNNEKKVKANLINAPAIIFDNKDNLHAKYLKHFFNIEDNNINYHIIPSVSGFRQFALNGYAYALIPEIHIRNELKQHKLIKLFPDKVWQMPVYWHSWSVETKPYKLFNELVRVTARKMLCVNSAQ